jgi:diguanylate cyclase (GGDEF)-like protein
MPPGTLPQAMLDALFRRPVAQLLVFPAHLKSRLDSLLLLAYATPPQNLDEIAQSGRSLADRLSIAAANIAREQMLYDQAHFDALTQLPNRLLLRDRTEQAIVHADRTETSVALLFIDLDGFKQVNDSLGHTQGDILLVEYGARLRQRMRQGDTVARMGGDEFVVLIPDLARDTAYATVDRIARALNEALAEPFQLGEQHLVSPASIGIALYPDNASSHEELLKMADAAMYESKRRAPGGYCFFTSNISELTRDRFELTQDLRDAIQRRELLLHYQPKVDARSGRLAGAEALLRWQSPKRGLVSPGVFVHLLDEMGLSIWLGEWVLDQACAQMHAWDQQGYPPFPVSINFSPLQFERTPVLARVQAALDQYRLQPDRLELEILESMAASESPTVRENLVRLRALGVRIALDDFGTGFSSLVHLTQVPADILKLDRVFTRSLCTETRQREIVGLIIAMAKVMDLTVVAEGVENEDQRELLPRMGCDLLQGYLVGRPIAPDEFAARWLAAGPSEETSAAWTGWQGPSDARMR